jgi:DNA-directed RNA polymerase specialized sigma24 family protein
MEKIMIKKDADYAELKKIAQKYGVSRSTLWRARKRGYFCFNYHKREVEIDNNIDNDVVKEWYEIAWKVYFKQFKNYMEEKEDLVQEAVIRLWELSGKEEINSFGYKWSICVNAMRSWLANGFSRRLSSEEARDNNYIFDIECVDRSYLNFELWEAIYRNFSEKERKEIQEFINGNKATLSERVKSKLFKLLTSN